MITSDVGPFAIMPRWLIRSALSDGAKLLYAALADRADRETGQCAGFGRRTLANDLGVRDVSAITRRIKELEDAGAIEVIREFEPGGAQVENVYVVKMVCPAGLAARDRQAPRRKARPRPLDGPDDSGGSGSGATTEPAGGGSGSEATSGSGATTPSGSGATGVVALEQHLTRTISEPVQEPPLTLPLLVEDPSASQPTTRRPGGGTAEDPPASAPSHRDLAKRLVAGWWERQKVKPVGKGAYFAAVAVVAAALDEHPADIVERALDDCRVLSSNSMTLAIIRTTSQPPGRRPLTTISDWSDDSFDEIERQAADFNRNRTTRNGGPDATR